MLEVVHVDIAGGQADVGRDPVGELHQLHFQALLAGLFHGGLQGNGEGGGGADLERRVGGEDGAAEQAEGEGQGFERVAQAFGFHRGRGPSRGQGMGCGCGPLRWLASAYSEVCRSRLAGEAFSGGRPRRCVVRAACGPGGRAFPAGCRRRRRSCRSRGAAVRG